MTGYTICSKGYEMLSGKWFVNLQVTIAACVLIERRNESAYMAVFTDIIRMCLQREAGGIVIKRNLIPRAGIMAGGALHTIRALMRVILGMAGGAVLRCTLKDAVDMTALAFHIRMLTIKMECKLRVIHIGGFPAFGRVAVST
jgi:hypothetical protein